MAEKLKHSALFILNTLNTISKAEYENLIKLIDTNPNKARCDIKKLIDNYNRTPLNDRNKIMLAKPLKPIKTKLKS